MGMGFPAGALGVGGQIRVRVWDSPDRVCGLGVGYFWG